LTGAANKTLSVLYRKSATRRAVAAWEALEERILFGYTPGYNQTPIPTAPCTGPICQCPTPVTGGNGGPGAGAGRGGGGGGPGGPSANGPGGGPSSDGLHNDLARVSPPPRLLPEQPIAAAGAAPPATTEAPITAFDGVPKISSTDLQSTNFGITLGHRPKLGGPRRHRASWQRVGDRRIAIPCGQRADQALLRLLQQLRHTGRRDLAGPGRHRVQLHHPRGRFGLVRLREPRFD